MRIDCHYKPQQVPESDQTTRSNSAGNNQAAARMQSGEDQAQLSGAHLEIQALASQASQLPEVREERVQFLRQAISSGQYQTNPEKVAGALFAHMASGVMA